jgi:hypothetical protein
MAITELLAPDDAQSAFYRDVGEAFHLAALLYWPGNQRRQKEAIATWAATLMGMWVEAVGILPDLFDAVLQRWAADFGLTVEELRATPRIRKLLAQMRSPAGQGEVAAAREEVRREIDCRVFAPAGGLLPVSAAPGLAALADEQGKTAQGPEGMCGRLLLVLASAERHHARELASVSLNRVMAAMEEPGHTIRWMKDAWAKTRGAHLWAAFAVAIADELQRGESFGDAVDSVLARPQRRREVLGYAAWFKEWGERFTPKGAAHPLFRRHSLVLLQAPPLEPPLQPLPAELIRRMAAYRAPKDF